MAITTDCSSSRRHRTRPKASQLVAACASVLLVSCARVSPEQAIEIPDLSGVWGAAVVYGLEFVRPEKLPDGSICVSGCSPQPEGEPPADAAAPDFPRYRPEFLARVADLRDRQVQTDTVLRCYPPGVPRIGPPAKIVQTGSEVVFFYDDYNGSFFRIVPVDGRRHRQDVAPSYLGDAIGWFEEHTLIVETVNFTDDTWLTDNGAFHTRDLRVVERLRREGDTIHYQAVVHDPGVLVEPWVMKPRELTRSTVELEESPRCEERDLQHMVDGSYHENPR
jgi:hypothetical protein